MSGLPPQLTAIFVFRDRRLVTHNPLQTFGSSAEQLIDGLRPVPLAAMTAAHSVASWSPDRKGVCCAGRSAPFECEMVTGPGFSSPNQLDQERTTAIVTTQSRNCIWMPIALPSSARMPALRWASSTSFAQSNMTCGMKRAAVVVTRFRSSRMHNPAERPATIQQPTKG